MNITEDLVAEHSMLRQLFDQVEHELPGIASIESLNLLARIIARLLLAHGETEKEMVLCALDHSLEDQGRRDRLHQEHQELDERFEQVQSATDLETARTLLYNALEASRKHFKFEEESLFPFAAGVLGPDMMLALGQFRALSRPDAEPGRATL
jgi:hemerythrin-like domain-containing protein